jgi:hypothetical protein
MSSGNIKETVSHIIESGIANTVSKIMEKYQEELNILNTQSISSLEETTETACMCIPCTKHFDCDENCEYRDKTMNVKCGACKFHDLDFAKENNLRCVLMFEEIKCFSSGMKRYILFLNNGNIVSAQLGTIDFFSKKNIFDIDETLGDFLCKDETHTNKIDGELLLEKYLPAINSKSPVSKICLDCAKKSSNVFTKELYDMIKNIVSSSTHKTDYFLYNNIYVVNKIVKYYFDTKQHIINRKISLDKYQEKLDLQYQELVKQRQIFNQEREMFIQEKKLYDQHNKNLIDTKNNLEKEINDLSMERSQFQDRVNDMKEEIDNFKFKTQIFLSTLSTN